MTNFTFRLTTLTSVSLLKSLFLKSVEEKLTKDLIAQKEWDKKCEEAYCSAYDQYKRERPVQKFWFFSLTDVKISNLSVYLLEKKVEEDLAEIAKWNKKCLDMYHEAYKKFNPHYVERKWDSDARMEEWAGTHKMIEINLKSNPPSTKKKYQYPDNVVSIDKNVKKGKKKKGRTRYLDCTSCLFSGKFKVLTNKKKKTKSYVCPSCRVEFMEGKRGFIQVS
jgi:hypothetical protein